MENAMNRTRIFLRNKAAALTAVMFIDLLVPYAVTAAVTGRIEQNVSESIIQGRKVIIQYKNATQAVDLNQFIVMVLAARFDKSQEIEVLKAESVMVRTDIYRVMGAAMEADSTSLGLEFLTEKQMKASWQENYESNYALIADCVASTGSSVLMYQNTYIEAKYTAVSAGKTLSGSEISEEKYAYLAAVDCPEDIKSTDYLRVETFTYKDFVKKIKTGYEQAGLHEEAPFQDIQIVSKTDSGYVTKIQAGNVIMSGTEFAKILGLSSAAMTIENSNGKIKITTKGLGDGMGVSLYTADFMAKQGSSYEQILKAFYSGITIVSQ